MKTFILTALCAVALTAQAQEAKRDTIDKYIIDKQVIGHFDGSQLEGKHISKYMIAYKDNGSTVVRNHVIYTSNGDEKAFTIEGDANGPIVISKVLGPLVIVDGKEVSHEEMSMIKSEAIASVNAFKPDSEVAKSYGEKGRKGVIVVTTKATSVTKVTDPLVIVDGKETSKEDFAKIKSEDIEHMTVLKAGSEAAIEKYGEKGSKGVIIVITKKDKKK